MARHIRVLSQYWGKIELPPELEEHVEIASVPPGNALPAELTGQVLLAVFGDDAVYALAECGVEWVHRIGTGLDRLDVARLARGRVLTNSRGAATIPISEWVLGVLLVRISPHISWSWPGAGQTVERIFVDNLRRYLAGEPLQNIIDPFREQMCCVRRVVQSVGREGSTVTSVSPSASTGLPEGRRPKVLRTTGVTAPRSRRWRQAVVDPR